MNSGPESCTEFGVVAGLFVILLIREQPREKHESPESPIIANNTRSQGNDETRNHLQVTRHGISDRDARTSTPRGIGPRPPAERSAVYRARPKVAAEAAPTKPPTVVQYRRPADRRSRPEQRADAVQTLTDLLGQFHEWRNKPPSSVANSATAEALDAALELPGHVEDLEAVELLNGFGWD